MPSRHLRNYRTWCDRLGNNPPLLLVAPSPAANCARYFDAAPNDVRVVTNVDHNVHTILRESPSCTTRALSAMWDKSTAYHRPLLLTNQNPLRADCQGRIGGDV